jgi:cytochrome c
LKSGFAFLLTIAAVLPPARAALTWSGCAAVQPSEFSLVRLIGKSSTNAPQTVDTSLTEPIKLAFDMDAAGNVDVYWVERFGAVKRYSVASKTVTLVGKLNPGTLNEDGLVGIVMDPGFKSNHWMYLYYSFGTEFRVSRFTLKDGKLDMASEIVVLHIPSDRDKNHTGGPMVFDAYGDMWISVGENSAGQRASANTNDLRGNILRIHPTPDGKYSIPAGNWKATLTGSYSAADLEKIKPEIYVKGNRNPYTIYVDPVRRWLTWGEVGPDWYDSGDWGHPTEEHNLAKAPGFYGWPIFAGPNLCSAACTQDPKAPKVTTSGVTGVVNLPPAIVPIHPYPRSAALSGPIYRYDGDNPSKIKLPPHFDRKWFLCDFRSLFDAATLSDDGTKITAEDTVFRNLLTYGGTNSSSQVDVQQGPDGALYVINYNGWYTTVPSTNIARIEYHGTCLPATPKLEQPTAMAAGQANLPVPGVTVEKSAVSITAYGSHRLRLFDLQGKEVFSANGDGPARYQLPPAADASVRILEVGNASGTLTRTLLQP